MKLKHYEGSCQCGAVQFDVDLNIDQTITCNCSRCKRMGFVLSFAKPEDFHLKTGEELLTEFLFNKKVIRHLFCKVCGVESFGYATMPDGSQAVGVNVNCLEGVNPKELNSQPFDGKSL